MNYRIGIFRNIYAKELNRDESDFRVIILARGIVYMIATILIR